jgi:hypothetical protein
MLANLILALTIILTPKAPTEPTVVSVGTDGLHVLQNPFKYQIEMKLDCGMSWEPVLVNLEPSSLTSVRIIQPDFDRYYPHCFYVSFKPKK